MPLYTHGKAIQPMHMVMMNCSLLQMVTRTQASIFDALDTMIIMDLEDEYQRALQHIKQVNWTNTQQPSKTFETNIRYLGGLLSAYDLRHDPLLLEKAKELADVVIMPAFNTPNRMPAAFVNVSVGQVVENDVIILAEFGSLQLELVRLSQLTGIDQYSLTGNHIIDKISQVPSTIPGLYPMIWSLQSFTPQSSYITISGGADSYYEYLLKTNILMGGNEQIQLNMWLTAVDSMQRYLRSETQNGNVYLAEFQNLYKSFHSGELICFIPSNLLLGARYLNNSTIEKFSKELMQSCYNVWVNTPTGIAPETWVWIDKTENMDFYPEDMQKSVLETGFFAQDAKYDLRPETIESLFYFYRLTGDKIYQDKAWTIFEAIEKYCKTSSGYTRIGNVMNIVDVKPLDFEESYFFAETLKYLYLIFNDPSYISLNEYVFNTEAHPFKLDKPIQVQATSFY
ncbi:glycoside hydrolase [Cokeromyces recurvatus]|uniref:glycoside hydrolase n=1 Tax=Cokeromyces recurvatus TaxID=90255 RepID=UPI00221EA234|nr:glycoside hydrolase [Cokeromyces recurvatus]KAI7905161.1 glycoside hydrolase [Cokeromyces recurvatus]